MSSTTSIFVRKGSFSAEINLIKYTFQAPCIVNIASGHILQYPDVSDDFDASFMVLSKRITDELLMVLSDSWLYSAVRSFPVVPVPVEDVADLNFLYQILGRIMLDKDNEYQLRAVVFALASFLFSTGSKFFASMRKNIPDGGGRLFERFINLVRENYKRERMLDFYARKLQVTPKHLSRTVKEQTGYSAAAWINRFVILEAKVLLKSSNLHVQQIADELNFASQSFFGKYFKRQTGLSPREFRNSKDS
ncbi:MAG: helix-turn-helix domain-containing protein [Clostridium sp.]|nr:helix-turn-helix domain-containing protein [Clostridium sp.]